MCCAITSVVFTLTFVSVGKIGMLLFGVALVNLNGNVDIANQTFATKYQLSQTALLLLLKILLCWFVNY